MKVVRIPFEIKDEEIIERTLAAYFKDYPRLVGMLATDSAREFYLMKATPVSKPLTAISDIRPLNKDA